MSTLFINGSPHKDGNTVAMAKSVLAGKTYDTVDLIDFKIYPLGQKYADDEFDKLWEAMAAADTIVLGTPVYWYDISSLLKNVIDRSYNYVYSNDLVGKKLIFLIQGAGPNKLTIESTKYLAERFADLFHMELAGYACGMDEAKRLARRLAR